MVVRHTVIWELEVRSDNFLRRAATGIWGLVSAKLTLPDKKKKNPFGLEYLFAVLFFNCGVKCTSG